MNIQSFFVSVIQLWCMICLLTSLLFIPCAMRAIQAKLKLASFVLTSLCATSCLHHRPSGCHPLISRFDKIVAHIAGCWGIFQGIKYKKFYLIPHGLWSPIAFYGFESRSEGIWVDIIHASIHISSAVAFNDIITKM